MWYNIEFIINFLMARPATPEVERGSQDVCVRYLLSSKHSAASHFGLMSTKVFRNASETFHTNIICL